MPWNGSNAHNFTEQSIIANAPAVSGVYALFNEGRWLYIGEGADLQARLLQHRRDSHNPCVNMFNPSFFAFEQVGALGRILRQDQLIVEMSPACNKRLG
jgi:hypothetical protein